MSLRTAISCKSSNSEEQKGLKCLEWAFFRWQHGEKQDRKNTEARHETDTRLIMPPLNTRKVWSITKLPWNEITREKSHWTNVCILCVTNRRCKCTYCRMDGGGLEMQCFHYLANASLKKELSWESGANSSHFKQKFQITFLPFFGIKKMGWKLQCTVIKNAAW